MIRGAADGGRTRGAAREGHAESAARELRVGLG